MRQFRMFRIWAVLVLTMATPVWADGDDTPEPGTSSKLIALDQVARVVGPIVCVASVVSPRLAGIDRPWRVTLPELVLAFGLMLGGLAGSLRFEVRASLVTGAGVGLAWLLLLVYGPSAEVGIAQFVPVLGASLLLGRREGIAVLGFTSVLMIATGVALVMHYTPHTSLAFASVEQIGRAHV